MLQAIEVAQCLVDWIESIQSENAPESVGRTAPPRLVPGGSAAACEIDPHLGFCRG
jgi:hypothetical protein